MATKRTVITVRKSAIEALCKSQGVSRSTVYNALNKTTNSETAQQIRLLALRDYDGKLTTKIIW